MTEHRLTPIYAGFRNLGRHRIVARSSTDLRPSWLYVLLFRGSLPLIQLVRSGKPILGSMSTRLGEGCWYGAGADWPCRSSRTRTSTFNTEALPIMCAMLLCGQSDIFTGVAVASDWRSGCVPVEWTTGIGFGKDGTSTTLCMLSSVLFFVHFVDLWEH